MNVSKILKAAHTYYLAVMAGRTGDSGWLMPDGEVFEEESGHAKAFNDWLAKKYPPLVELVKREFENNKVKYEETGDGEYAELLGLLNAATVFPSYIFGVPEFLNETSSIFGVPPDRLSDWGNYDLGAEMGDDSALFSRDFGGIRFFKERMGNEINFAAWEWSSANLANAQALVFKLLPNEVRVEEYSTGKWGMHDTEDFLKFRGFGRMWNG